MIAAVWAFLAALRAGDFAARALAVGLALAAFVAFATVVVHRIEQRALEQAEAARQARGQERITEMEKRNEAFRRLEDRERCLVFARDSGLQPEVCN